MATNGTHKLRVGIISMPHKDGPRKDESHIMSPYIDWHTTREIDPVVIPYDTKRPDWYFHKVDGIVIPGGGAKANLKLFGTVWAFLEHSLKLWYESNKHFPIWGTCLGFEIILMLTGGLFPLKKYDAEDAKFPLKWTNDTKNSRMWSGPQMTTEFLKIISTNPSALNNHTWGISPQMFRANKILNELFVITSTSRDNRGAVFVESFEGRNGLPIYGVQWHPERQPMEMGPLLDFWKNELERGKNRKFHKNFLPKFSIRKGKCIQYSEHAHIDCFFIKDGSDKGGSIDEQDVPLFIHKLLGDWAKNFNEKTNTIK